MTALHPRLSVVVPAFNEEHRIAGALDRIAAYLDTLPFTSEVVVVDDGSAPAGREALEQALSRLPPSLTGHLLRHETNRGKGAAVRTGCLAAKGDYVAFIDADLATPPEALDGLIAALDAGAAVALGVRRQADGSDMREHRSLPRRLAGMAFSLTVQALLLPGISDSQCPLKAFRRDAAHSLFSLQRIDTWSFDAELLFLARQMGFRIAQVPVSWTAVEGSHLRLSRSAGELLNLLRIRWMHRGVRAVTRDPAAVT